MFTHTFTLWYFHGLKTVRTNSRTPISLTAIEVDNNDTFILSVQKDKDIPKYSFSKQFSLNNVLFHQ